PVAEAADGARSFPAQMSVDAALHDREQRLTIGLFAAEALVFRQAACQPAYAALARVPGRGLVALSGDHMIELHDHVGSQVVLDAHDTFGREHVLRAVEMTS